MLQKDKQGVKNQVGAYGEEIVVQDLERKGYHILERNYLRKWGEIDVIAHKGSVLHFVEVKTASHETKEQLRAAVSRRTFRPEENVHQAKLQRMYRAIDTWLTEQQHTGAWQIDVAAVRIVPNEKYATIKYIDNIIE